MAKEHFPYVSIVAVVAVVAVVVLLLSLQTTTKAPAMEVTEEGVEEGAAEALAGQAGKWKVGGKITTASCVDKDGVDVTVKGTSTGKLFNDVPKVGKKGQTVTVSDTCTGEKSITVQEWVCGKDMLMQKSLSCFSGQVCDSGKCVEVPPAPTFCYYLSETGSQWPAGKTYYDVTHEVTEGSGTQHNRHKGVITQEGTFYNECVPSSNGQTGAWTASSTKSMVCGVGSAFVSGENVAAQLVGPSYGTMCTRSFYGSTDEMLDYGSEKGPGRPDLLGCNPSTGSCCYFETKNFVDPESYCDSDTAVRKWYSSCGGEPTQTTLNCAQTKSTFSGRQMSCVTKNNYWGFPYATCAEPACTPGEVVIRCLGGGPFPEEIGGAIQKGEFICKDNGKWGYKDPYTSCPTGQTCKMSSGLGYCG